MLPTYAVGCSALFSPGELGVFPLKETEIEGGEFHRPHFTIAWFESRLVFSQGEGCGWRQGAIP
jgi:hypothetical protein